MELGCFSVSLTVKDIDASIAFYTKLGFEERGGGDKWRIMTSGTTKIGLFEGMFDKNLLTFNPGWDDQATPLEAGSFTDVRQVRERLVDAGITPVDDNTSNNPTGPAHIIVVDPDGNPVMFDQHV